MREFNIGDAVYVKNFIGTPAWLPGVIEKCHDPLSYLVKLQNNEMVRHHVNHVKIRMSNNDVTNISDSDDDFLLIGGQLNSPAVEQTDTAEVPNTVEPRRSTRVQCPPNCWSPDDNSSL